MNKTQVFLILIIVILLGAILAYTQYTQLM